MRGSKYTENFDVSSMGTFPSFSGVYGADVYVRENADSITEDSVQKDIRIVSSIKYIELHQNVIRNKNMLYNNSTKFSTIIFNQTYFQ